jgi:AAA+ ATPase superfamily predicted ATPase
VEKKRLAEEAKAVEMKRCEEQRPQQVIYNAQVLPVTLALILFFLSHNNNSV